MDYASLLAETLKLKLNNYTVIHCFEKTCIMHFWNRHTLSENGAYIPSELYVRRKGGGQKYMKK